VSRLGFILPRPDVCSDRRAVLEVAQSAEEHGYAYARLFDHVVGADPSRHDLDGPYTVDDPFYEPFVTGAFLAGATRLGLVTGVLVLPQRQAVLVAKQAAELDRLLGGDLRLGVGLGWNQPEYSALGSEFKGRAARLEEQIALLRDLWSKRSVTFPGRWHQVDGVGLNPLPVRRRVPLWIGCGDAPSSLDRVARLADGWLPSPFLSPEAIRGGWNEIRRLAEKHGRDPALIGLEGRLDCPTPSTKTGDAASFWWSLGVTHLTVKTVDPPAGGFATRVADPSYHVACLANAARQLRAG
jgi:probable F420-dependent oxidoreductase